jgi:hypothetical protein
MVPVSLPRRPCERACEELVSRRKPGAARPLCVVRDAPSAPLTMRYVIDSVEKPPHPGLRGCEELPEARHSGARAPPANPEPMNTNLQPVGKGRVRGFRVCPFEASRNDDRCRAQFLHTLLRRGRLRGSRNAAVSKSLPSRRRGTHHADPAILQFPHTLESGGPGAVGTVSAAPLFKPGAGSGRRLWRLSGYPPVSRRSLGSSFPRKRNPGVSVTCPGPPLSRGRRLERAGDLITASSAGMMEERFPIN